MKYEQTCILKGPAHRKNEYFLAPAQTKLMQPNHLGAIGKKKNIGLVGVILVQ